MENLDVKFSTDKGSYKPDCAGVLRSADVPSDVCMTSCVECVSGHIPLV